MFSIDERLKGLPALKDQVVQVYQSLNQPNLAIPGRRAGPAMAFVLGLRGPQGFAVFVYLYLSESGECAVYAPSSGAVPRERYEGEEAEALGFVESMGFMMDNLNFRARPADEQDLLVSTLTVFQREPPPPEAVVGLEEEEAPRAGRRTGASALGRLFGAFCLAALALPACAHVSEKDKDQAQIHVELAAQGLLRNPQSAYKECEEALALNPENADAWHVKALLLHHSFGRQEEALVAYKKAVELKQPFSEARTNLGTLYMDQKRYDDAIKEYEIALNDVLYTAPFIAQANMGWAFYKKGNVKDALDHLKASVIMNPKFCIGYLQLGQIFEDQGNAAESCKYYGRYRENCADAADAWQRVGVCLAKQGQRDEAAKHFDACVEKSKNDDVKEQCQKLKEQLAR